MAGNRSGMTVANWMLTILLVSIPGVGLIMAIIWACGVGNNTRVNFGRAVLIWKLIVIIMYIVAFSDVFSEISNTVGKLL